MISIIVAIARNGVIGGDNSLLWHISEDLQRFKRITTGHPVIMGRKTFESLGRPLPKRVNVVVTRQKDYRAEGCTVVHSLDEAVGLFPAQEEVFIIGGGDIYRQALPAADRLHITRVMHDYRGDTLFPDIDTACWKETFREYHDRGKDFEYPFEYVDYVKER
jgi:dihydrofolate reductase